MNWPKAQRMEALSCFMKEGKVDEDIIRILELINRREDSFTSSSCSGRIGLMEIPELGDKRGAVFHGKWHRTVSPDEFKTALREYDRHLLYLLVQPPILHIYCRTMEEAKNMIKIGRQCGFKDSAFRSIEAPFLVALITTEHLNVPLAENGTLFPDDEHVDFLVERANTALLRARGKMKRLEEALEVTQENTLKDTQRDKENIVD